MSGRLLAGLALGLAGALTAAPPPEPPPPSSGWALDTPAPCACAPQPVLPVALRVRRHRDTWLVELRFPRCAQVADLRVRFDDGPERSLGHLGQLDLMTGRNEAAYWFEVSHHRVAPGEHTVTAGIVRPDGTIDGPHRLPLSTHEVVLAEGKRLVAEQRNSFVSFAEHSDLYTWLMFTPLFDVADAWREVRYSIDDCSLRERLAPDALSDPARPEAITAARPYLALPRTTRSACAQVVFADGTLSRVLELVRRPG
jgi:hypothetical protein